MAKNFSVEWLSQSFYTTQTDGACSPRSQISSEAPSESILSVVIEEHGIESRGELSPNNSCGFTSGSESEVGVDSEGESALNRRMRTKFTSDQISRLERTFNKHRYLGAKQRRKIAEKLTLSETQVKIWFQNRRMKMKREVQHMLSDFMLPPLVLAAAPAFQHHALAGQLPGYSPSAHAPYTHHMQRLAMQNMVHHQQPFHPMTLASCYY